MAKRSSAPVAHTSSVLIASNPGYFGVLGTMDDERTFAVESERLGYDSIWVAEPRIR